MRKLVFGNQPVLSCGGQGRGSTELTSLSIRPRASGNRSSRSPRSSSPPRRSTCLTGQHINLAQRGDGSATRRASRSCPTRPLATLRANNPALWENYPFQRLSEPTHILVMPAIHSAAITTKLVQALGEVAVVGPILVGLSRSVQVCGLGDSPTGIITTATLAAFGVQIASRDD